MLDWFYNWIAKKSGVYQKEIERKRLVEKSNQTLSTENYELINENSELRRDLTEAESYLEIEERKGDFLEEKVDELIDKNENLIKMGISEDFIDTLLKRAKAPLIYITSAKEVKYNPPSIKLLKSIEGITDLDLSGWSSIPIRNLEGNEIGRFYSNSSERTFFETVKRLYTELIGERKARKLVKQTLSYTQDNP